MISGKKLIGFFFPVPVSQLLDFSCGTNHTVAIDGRKSLFSWGFGGYDRLARAEPKDEFVLRLSNSSNLNPKALRRFIVATATFWRLMILEIFIKIEEKKKKIL